MQIAVCRLPDTPIRGYFERNGINKSPGCYAVFSNEGECLYVGRATYLMSRIAAHYLDALDGNGTRWRLTGRSEWYENRDFAPDNSMLCVFFTIHFKELEKFLIKQLKPSHNKHRYESTIREGVPTDT
jgi:hypothetical protein